jgi:hypothetical protein
MSVIMFRQKKSMSVIMCQKTKFGCDYLNLISTVDEKILIYSFLFILDYNRAEAKKSYKLTYVFFIIIIFVIL